MKKSVLFLACSAVALMASCNSDDNSSSVNDDNNNNNNNGEITSLSNIMKSGTWRITEFTDSGNNETGDYSGYNFKFNDTGVLEAVNNDGTVTGTWSVTNDSSDDDDNNSNDVDFNIGFANPPIFNELSDDWDIIDRTGVKLRLIDESGGNGGTDYLTFEKN